MEPLKDLTFVVRWDETSNDWVACSPQVLQGRLQASDQKPDLALRHLVRTLRHEVRAGRPFRDPDPTEGGPAPSEGGQVRPDTDRRPPT